MTALGDSAWRVSMPASALFLPRRSNLFPSVSPENAFLKNPATGGCACAERRDRSACGHHHLWLPLPESQYRGQAGGAFGRAVQPLLRGHPHHYRNEVRYQWTISSLGCVGECAGRPVLERWAGLPAGPCQPHPHQRTQGRCSYACERQMARSRRDSGRSLLCRVARPRRREGLGSRTKTAAYICCPRS